jgi:DNA-directed RNA polymerase specialized sigma24 family protein
MRQDQPEQWAMAHWLHHHNHSSLLYRPVSSGKTHSGRGEDVPHPLDPELASALQQLRPDERELLYLSAVEEYSANEIAKLTHKPRGTILSILHRTKKKLRQILAKEETGHTDERTA